MIIVRRRGMLAGCVAAAFAAPARAEGEWPKGPIRFIVPFPPGGSTDPVARIIQTRLIETTGWHVIVENKPGGTGAVGSAITAKAAPDGQTWMITFDSHILNPAFAPGLPYKDSDLFNVMEIGRTPQVIATHPDRPYKSFAEAVADAKKRPGKVSMGVLGASQALVLMTLVKKENDVDINLIPYKGGGPLNQDILAGVTDIAIGSLASLSPHIRANKVRAIAVTGEARTPALPDTPTLAEQGIKAFPSYSWWGVYAPTGTPRPIVDRMHAEIAKVVRSADITQKFVEQFNMEILTSLPEEFAAYQKSEQERWFKVIKDNDIKGD
ncbi:Bug family tripartite tricarboxylate transporter substrate binding protein [Reyranella sp.]|jgi:tripartite-type tricarboxylate transporter receptor subunit TctC|uniref:Bug family tripartite tricarboxylate transporter substrate binding protein n=1 Tax=Reyranella sp. TaxID=1929291 RepID=UPI002F944647